MTPKRTIGGKTLNSGIRGGLWEKKHSDAMGLAVFLFGWLIHRQTTQRNGTGLVLRGKPLTYEDISADTGWPVRTLQRWMARLKREGYIEVQYSIYGRMVIRILNAKKFNPKQFDLPIFSNSSRPPTVAEVPTPTVAEVTTKSGGFKEGALGLSRNFFGGAAPDRLRQDTESAPVSSVENPAQHFPRQLREVTKQHQLQAGERPAEPLRADLYDGIYRKKVENAFFDMRRHPIREQLRECVREAVTTLMLNRVATMKSLSGDEIEHRAFRKLTAGAETLAAVSDFSMRQTMAARTVIRAVVDAAAELLEASGRGASVSARPLTEMQSTSGSASATAELVEAHP
jgi:hypothetical protein